MASALSTLQDCALKLLTNTFIQGTQLFLYELFYILIQVLCRSPNHLERKHAQPHGKYLYHTYYFKSLFCRAVDDLK